MKDVDETLKENMLVRMKGINLEIYFPFRSGVVCDKNRIIHTRNGSLRPYPLYSFYFIFWIRGDTKLLLYKSVCLVMVQVMCLVK